MQDRGQAVFEVVVQVLVAIWGEKAFQVTGQQEITFLLDELSKLVLEGVAGQVIG